MSSTSNLIESEASPLLTVAICTRNRAGFLKKAMLSVLGQITDNTELLVVDNASTDDSAATIRSLAVAHPCVTFQHEEQIGISAARNTALQKASGRYVLFLDDDATAAPGWLAAYLNFLRTPPAKNIAVVGGAVFPEFEIPPPKWIAADSANVLDLWPVPTRFGYRGGPWEGNCAYDRAAAMQVGLFDLRLGPHGTISGYREGADLNLRLQDAGYEIWWLPGAAIRHTVHANRLNLRWALRAAFGEGRSITIQRLKEKKTRHQRILFRLGRVLVSPFQILLCLFGALLTLPWRQGRTAVGCLLRAWRVAGITRAALW